LRFLKWDWKKTEKRFIYVRLKFNRIIMLKELIQLGWFRILYKQLSSHEVFKLKHFNTTTFATTGH